jgi:hypothetical protein
MTRREAECVGSILSRGCATLAMERKLQCLVQRSAAETLLDVSCAKGQGLSLRSVFQEMQMIEAGERSVFLGGRFQA